ncbi:protein kinase [Trypanosoma cruzi]|nr:protein kinase [Trypanosoma cruzi]
MDTLAGNLGAARTGIQQYTVGQANVASGNGGKALNSARSTMTTSQSTNSARRSGSKRDRETATSTDITRTKSQYGEVTKKQATATTTTNNTTTTTTATAGGANRIVEVLPLPKKKKVTYALPNQSREEGHFYVVLGEDIDVSTQRFKILSMLGEGTFGKVVEAWDRKRKEYCAVKIVRNVPKYTRDAKIEIQFMEKVRQADADDRFSLMKIQRYSRTRRPQCAL